MTRIEMEEIAERAATKALHAMFLTLGVDVTNPESIIEFQADMKHVRQWRMTTETARGQVVKTVVGTLLAGAIGWISLLIWKGQ